MSLVNFWASWCPPCRAEHPVLLELQEQGITIYGVNIKDDPAQAIKYINDDGNPFAGIAFDPQGRTAIDWGVTALPETFIVDGDGTILFRYAGPLVGSDYLQRFLPALEQPRQIGPDAGFRIVVVVSHRPPGGTADSACLPLGRRLPNDILNFLFLLCTSTFCSGTICATQAGATLF